MDEQNSILDKIIESKQQKEAAQFDPTDIVSNLFKNLSAKERDILHRRFGLFSQPKQTLEQIGKYYEITRERIRQIEVSTIKKLQEIEDFRQHLEAAENNITHLLQKYGGFMEEGHLIEELLTYTEPSDANRQASQFIMNNLMNGKLDRIKSSGHSLPGWKLPAVSTNVIEDALKELKSIIDEHNRLLTRQELLEKFLEKDFYNKRKNELFATKLGEDKSDINREEIDSVLHSLLKLSKHIDSNILDEWGLSKWQTVKPRRMSDKAYLVLRRNTKPMHFTDITKSINESSFDKKVAYPATIHNELILDDRFVLVGRGIYALKEWGYKSGTVLDIITDILQKAGQPLSKEEIVKQVLDQRIVRKSTIYLALTNKDKIKKLSDGRYALA